MVPLIRADPVSKYMYTNFDEINFQILIEDSIPKRDAVLA